MRIFIMVLIHLAHTGNANRNTFSGDKVNRQQLDYYQRKPSNVFIPETITRPCVEPQPVEADTSTLTTNSKFRGCHNQSSMEVQSSWINSSSETHSAVNISPQNSRRSSKQPRTNQISYHVNNTIYSDSPVNAGCGDQDTTSQRRLESSASPQRFLCSPMPSGLSTPSTHVGGESSHHGNTHHFDSGNTVPADVKCKSIHKNTKTCSTPACLDSRSTSLAVHPASCHSSSENHHGSITDSRIKSSSTQEHFSRSSSRSTYADSIVDPRILTSTNRENTRTHGVDLLDSHYSQEVQHQPSTYIVRVSEKIMIRLPHCSELQTLERAFSMRPSNQALGCQSVRLTISDPKAERSWKIVYRLPQNHLTTLRKALGAMYDSQCTDFQFVDMNVEYISHSPPLPRNERDLEELDSERILVQIPPQCSDIELLRLAISQGCCETNASASHRLVQVSTFPADTRAESIIYYPSSHLQSLQDALNYSHSNGDIAEIHVRYLSDPAELEASVRSASTYS